MTDFSTGWLVVFVAAALGALTLLRPAAAVALVLSSLPLFAHKTASGWGFRFFVLLTSFEIAYLVRCRRAWRLAPPIVAGNRVLSLASLYVAASVLSLASLPLLGLVWQHTSAVLAMPASAWARYFTGLLTLAETDRAYSLLTVVETLEAFAFCLIVWREARRSPSFLPATGLGITAGLVAFVGLGLLEFQGVVSLHAWRGEMGAYFDPSFTRLYSIAGNPGWFAEQVVFSMPFAVVMLPSGPWRTWLFAGLPVLLVVISLALVLSFQRGSWIAATAVMLFLAAVLLPSGLFGSDTRSMRRGCLRLALLATTSVVITAVAFSLSLLNPRARVQDPAPYLARLKSITDSSARLPYFRVGYQLGALHPVLGGGSESYAYRYVQHFVMDGGAYKHQPLEVLFFPSAHNVYLQTFAGKGLVGLLLLLSIFVFCLAAALPILIKPAGTPDPRRLSLIAATGSLVGFGVYGMFQEIFYIPSLQLLFFAVVGMIAALAHERVQWGPGIRRALWITLAVAFAAHLVYEYVYPGPTRVLRGEPTGFFAEERDLAGDPFRWSTERAWVPVPPAARTVSLEERSVAPYAQQTDIRVCGQRIARLEMTNQDWRPVQSQTPAPTCQSLPYLEIRTVPAWVPGADPRLLGVMVRKIEFR